MAIPDFIPAPSAPATTDPIAILVQSQQQDMMRVYQQNRVAYESAWNHLFQNLNNTQAILAAWGTNAVRFLDLLNRLGNFVTSAKYTPAGIPASITIVKNADGAATVTKP